ncbi:hypothetical protein [Cupriavidus basilensis]|uniref:Uncharacterized protein n=1 Tax=Cupriavidus basilensis TaxID=68895 RepID=A0A643G5S2_9BURK|nr:hypothetical protein [Cupriavidus basilensis]QOT77594.1 hypothetical protein F7R26_005990 [Cupriavidus basilensis]
MSADERFIAGEDRLAALLRELPAFAPPASLEASVMAAARAEQAARNAPAPLPPASLPARVRAYAEQAEAPADDDELDFTPPAGLQAAVMAQAARMQAAQATRRDAVLEEVRRGDAPQSVLGAPVSEAAQAWLREQALSARPAAGAEPTAKPPRARRARRWWPALGALAATLGIGVLSLQIVMRQLDLRHGEITLPAQAPAPAADTAANKTAKQAEPAKPVAQAAVQPAAPAPAQQAESAGQPASPRADAPVPPPATQAAQAVQPAPAPASPPTEAQAKAAPREPDRLAQQHAPEPRESAAGMAGSLSAGAPPAAAAAPAVRAPAPMASMAPIAPMAAMALPAPITPIAPIAPPAPAPAIDAPRLALRASPSQQADAARAPAPAARGQRAGTLTMSLREEPQLAVERLLSAPSGAEPAAGAQLALRVTASAPGSPEVRAWVERLWQAVPAQYRPPLPYAVQADSTLPPATVRIERQADSAPW